MHNPPALPAPLQLAPFHVREAIELGVEPARLRRADLTAPFRGIRSSTAVSTTSERCLAYLPLLAPDQCFSHTTAAVLWGIWIPLRLVEDPMIHVLSTGSSREPRMRGVYGHRIAGSVTVTMSGALPLTSALDTWWQLASSLSADEMVAAGDSLVRRQHALMSIDKLSAAVQNRAGRRGAAVLRRAMGRVRAGADSPRETHVRLLLVAAGLPEPLVNAEIIVPGHPRRIFGDLVYQRYLVLVEYDGEQHRVDSRQYAADVERLEALAIAGWLVVRVLANDLRDPERVARRVAGALHPRGWRPSRSKLQLLR